MLFQEVRFALRMWRAHPLLIGAAILSLGVGMGANTALFSVLNAALLSAAPVADPSSLSLLYSTSAAGPELQGTSFQNYEDLRKALPFDLAAAAPISVGLSADGGQPEELFAELVSDNYFDLLGVSAAHGRAFRTGEGIAPGSYPFVVISDTLWQRRFNRRADAVGQKVTINARPFTIMGVAPAGFASLAVLRAIEVWIPVAMHQEALTGVQSFYFRQRSGGMFDVVLRTAPPLTMAQIRTTLAAQANALAASYPKENKGLSFEIRPLRQAGMNPGQRASWVRAGQLVGAVVALVLLIACVNVANLLLARSAVRQREIAVRTAIGASRGQLIRQSLVESLMLSLAGALAGIAIAAASVQLLKGLRPAFIPASFEAPLNGTVLLFTSAVAVATAMAFGLVPAVQAAREDVVIGLKEGRGISRASRFGRGLLVAQSALASLALVLAALFLRSLQEAQALDPGFNRTNLAVISFDLGMLRYDNTQGPEFVRRVNERMAATAGVMSSAVSSHVVLDGAPLASKIRVGGRPDAELMSVRAQAVGADYFRVMDIPVLDGRAFRSSDTGISPVGWAVVNETLANQLWPGTTPLGRQFEVLGIQVPYVVIGLVADSLYETLGERPQPYFYIYYDQSPGLKKLSLYVRTAGDPRALLSTIENEVRAVDPNLPLLAVRTVSDVLHRSMWIPRTGSALLTLFGVMSLTLAAIGMYGVTAFFVRQQWREIGIRAALGATRATTLSYVVRWTLLPALSGMVLGLTIALFGGRAVAGLLIGVAPSDPASFASTAIILSLVSAAASVLPALTAMRMNPARALADD